MSLSHHKVQVFSSAPWTVYLARGAEVHDKWDVEHLNVLYSSHMQPKWMDFIVQL